MTGDSTARRRWADEITRLMQDFPRQQDALEYSMNTFGEGFDLATFKAAYETREEIEAYVRAQGLERGVGRLQNYVSDLAINGVRLAGLPTVATQEGGSPAQLAFAAMREANVITPSLVRRLERAHRGRARLEHSYVRMPAGDVHRLAALVFEGAQEFIQPYRIWIEPLLRQ